MSEPIDDLIAVARALGELREAMVFVGGASVAVVLSDDPLAEPRATDARRRVAGSSAS